MTPQLTVNLLRVLFVTFCAAVGSLVSSEAQGDVLPGLLVGRVFGLLIGRVDRRLRGLSLRGFFRATLGLLLRLFLHITLLPLELLDYLS